MVFCDGSPSNEEKDEKGEREREVKWKRTWLWWLMGAADRVQGWGCIPVWLLPISKGLCFQRRQDTAFIFRLLFWDLLHSSSKKLRATLLYVGPCLPSGPAWPWDWIDRREKAQTYDQEQERAGRGQEARGNGLDPDLGAIFKIFFFLYIFHPSCLPPSQATTTLFSVCKSLFVLFFRFHI